MTTRRAVVFYDSFGFRTRNGVLWMASVLGVLFLVLVIMHGVSSSEPIFTTIQIVWVINVNLVTYRLLRKLEPLERERPEPDDGMKLVFHCAKWLPIYGYVPFLIILPSLIP